MATEAEQADLGKQQQQQEEENTHDHEHHAEHCEHHHHGGAFDLTILVPRASFTNQGAAKTSSSGKKSTKDSENLDDYVPLFLPATNADVLRDIKQSVADSAEGFWIGAHSYQRVTLREEAPDQEGDEPKLFLEGQDSQVYPETADLGTVFAGEEYKSHELRRALKAVETPYSDSEARAHVLRVRDASLSYTAALHAKRVYQPPPYDPSQMVIDAGLSLFPAIRGPIEDSETQQETEQAEGAQVNGAQSGKGSKKSKGKATNSAKPAAKAAPTSAKKESTPFVPSASFLDANQDPLTIYQARKNLLPQSSLPPAAFKNLQLSVWNPPPQHLRLRGHYLYLNVATLEGENYHISATRNGFYVNKSDNHHFDPSPKSQSSKAHPQGHLTHHTLFGLLSALSPQFAERTQALITDVVPMSPDFFASLAITTCQPSAPWLVPEPSPIADGARSQTTFLLTGSTNADYLPNSKDWNEELASMRELPKETNDDKLMRDRYACRLHNDFQSAAARGVISIARGDVPPLNAIDASEANSYLAYNILFTPAQDSADTYKHLGGDEAARVTASKDVWATKLLSDADITGLHTIATAIIDYCGERWIAQAIPPGIFNKTPLEETPASEEESDETVKKEESTETKEKAEPAESADKKVPQTVALRAVYGPANTDKPHERYVADKSFEPLAQKIAEHFHLAKHTVTDSKGRELEMWTPADVHGLIGSDSRMYAIDLFRLTPIDVKFLEEDTTKVIGEESTSEKEEDVYPHRVTLLRPELVEIYHSIKTREWIEKQVKEKTAQEKPEESSSTPAAIEDADNSIEKPDSATSEEFVKVDKEEEEKKEEEKHDADNVEEPKEKEQTVINVADFKLSFNPDAFVDRPDLPKAHWISKKDQEDEETKAVRDVSEYLRSTVIPALLAEVISEETLPLDSSELSQMMHRKGINMRYLGHIAEQCKEAPALGGDLKRTPEAEQEVISFLAKFKSFLIGDMIMRGAKHVLRSLIKDTTAIELTEAISHFLNCLLGTGLVAEPKAIDTTGSTRSWTVLTPSSLRDQITQEVRRRYRYVLPSDAFEENVSKLRILRELCMSTGIQMNLQTYTFEKPQVNGHHAEESSTQEQKNKAGNKKQTRSTSPVPTERQTTFTPEDILNVHPVIKEAPFKSSMVEDLLERGQMYFIRGNIELGEAFVNDALNMYDQIFGAIHPEMAEAYRQIGGLYHRMASPLLRRIQLYEQTRSLVRDEDRERIKTETGIDSEEALEQAKYQHEIYLQQAVKLTRQAVIISERVNGIDSSETLRYYSELAIFEHSVGNVELAMKLLQHTVELSNAIYGDNHPEKARAAFFAASMVKSFQPQNHLAAVPFFRSAQGLAQKAYGANSIMSANASYQLGQCYIVDGQLAESIPYIEEALRIFELRHGKEGDHTRDASQLLSVVKTAIEQEAKGELEKVQKLAKRIGADPARAKELINKLQGSSSSSSFARRGGRSSAQIAADDAVQASNGAVTAAKDTTGTKGHLDVDDLVLFIEGGQKKPSTSGSKSGGKAKKNGSKK